MQKLFWPYLTVWINCSCDLKNFADSRPSALNFKRFSQSLEHFFLTVGQNNFGNKIPFQFAELSGWWQQYFWQNWGRFHLCGKEPSSHSKKHPYLSAWGAWMGWDIHKCVEHTLDSGINIGVRLLIFGFFSRGYVLIKESNP